MIQMFLRHRQEARVLRGVTNPRGLFMGRADNI